MKANILFITLFLSQLGMAQTWESVGELSINKTISSHSVDTQNRLYLGSTQGDVYRFDSDGSEDMHFSEIGNSPVTTIEVQNRLKVFAFFREIQQFSILDRFTTTPVNYNVDDFQNDLAWLVSPAIDNSIWMLVPGFNELRKYNIQTKQLILTTPLSIKLGMASHMLNFQNLIIISDEEEGIYFFDQYGNLIYQLEISGIKYFHIKDGVIIALTDEGVLSADPFSPMDYTMIVPPDDLYKTVIVVGNWYYYFQESRVRIFSLRP